MPKATFYAIIWTFHYVWLCFHVHRDKGEIILSLKRNLT